MEHDAQRADQRDADEDRRELRLPLRANEETAQPAPCNPRKHAQRHAKSMPALGVELDGVCRMLDLAPAGGPANSAASSS